MGPLFSEERIHSLVPRINESMETEDTWDQWKVCRDTVAMFHWCTTKERGTEEYEGAEVKRALTLKVIWVADSSSRKRTALPSSSTKIAKTFPI